MGTIKIGNRFQKCTKLLGWIPSPTSSIWLKSNYQIWGCEIATFFKELKSCIFVCHGAKNSGCEADSNDGPLKAKIYKANALLWASRLQPSLSFKPTSFLQIFRIQSERKYQRIVLCVSMAKLDCMTNCVMNCCWMCA